MTMPALTASPYRERRLRPRASYGRLIHFETEGGLMTATVEELSERGARLETPWVPPLHSEVTLHLPVCGRDGKVSTCLLSGCVVRTGDQEIGVAFAELLPRHMLQLRDLVWRSAPYVG
jgi:hypothetical protein